MRRRVKRKATGEKALFLEIWEEREHYCDNCKCHLGDEPLVFFFGHIKPKSVYPELRLDKKNIALWCFDCHQAHDHIGMNAFNKRKK